MKSAERKSTGRISVRASPRTIETVKVLRERLKLESDASVIEKALNFLEVATYEGQQYEQQLGQFVETWKRMNGIN